jgi:hypothetical protein
MVFDDYDTRLPIFFGILEREEIPDLIQYLQGIKIVAKECCPGWVPCCFMTDCARNKKAAIAAIFPMFLYSCAYSMFEKLGL